MIIENIRLVATKNVTENYGMMSRMRSELGMRQSQAPSASGFIIQNKIKRAMAEYARNLSTIEKTISIDRMISRLDRYSLDELKYLHSVLLEEGIIKLFDTIRMSRRVLISKINAINRHKEELDK
jgi:hypothetical protein